jgi:hypothetical protein
MEFEGRGGRGGGGGRGDVAAECGAGGISASDADAVGKVRGGSTGLELGSERDQRVAGRPLSIPSTKNALVT